jgi:hypothetical protein
MSDNLVTSVVTVLTAIVGVAVLAVLVSSRSNTANVLTAGGNAFANAVGAAVSPVTGSSSFGSGSFSGFTGGPGVLNF